MPYPQFDRRLLRLRSLLEREHRWSLDQILLDPNLLEASPPDAGLANGPIVRIAERIRGARQRGAACVLSFGAHAIRNGLTPVLLRLAQDGWITHFATNGCASLTDWELACIGRTGEHVRTNQQNGSFGLWEETGLAIGLAVALGALHGRGYGEAVGFFINEGALEVPAPHALRALMTSGPAPEAAAAGDLLELMEAGVVAPGLFQLGHPFARHSLQAGLQRLGVPLTVHPGIGYDILYEHPATSGAAFGRAAYRDFLTLAHTATALSGGVYLSVGSAVMSPMVLEKAFAMAQNLAVQQGSPITGHYIGAVDIVPSQWDWNAAEPPPDRSAYYLRACKSFSRLGGEMEYIEADNRVFLGRLLAELKHDSA